MAERNYTGEVRSDAGPDRLEAARRPHATIALEASTAVQNQAGHLPIQDPALTGIELLDPQNAASIPRPQVTDEQLLDRAAAGDGEAFHALVERHLDRLYRLAVSMIGSAPDAEDVLQEALAGAYRGIAKFERRASVGTWLTRILVMQVARWRREKYRRRDRTPIEEAEAESSAAFSVSDKEMSGGPSGTDAKIDVQAALNCLSPAHREVIVLREFEKMQYDEIADLLGVPQGTVESRLHRARAELKQLLSAYLP